MTLNFNQTQCCPYTKLHNHIRYIVNRIIFNNRAVRVLETSTFGLVEMEEKMTIATVTGMCTFNKAIVGIYCNFITRRNRRCYLNNLCNYCL